MDTTHPWDEKFNALSEQEQSVVSSHLETLDRLEERLAIELANNQGNTDPKDVVKLWGQFGTLAYQTLRILKIQNYEFESFRSYWKDRKKVGA